MIVKPGRLVILTCFATVMLATSIQACSQVGDWYGNSRAETFLSRMRAEDYFAGGQQQALARAAGRGDQRKMKLAIEAGAGVNFIGKHGMATLYWPILRRNIAGLEYLLEQGANPNVVTQVSEGGSSRQDRVSAIELAVILKDSRYLEALLKHGGNANLVMNDWNQPVIYEAILYRRLNNVMKLVEHGADVNFVDKTGGTPLSEAVKASVFEIALFLLRAGADPTLKDAKGWSAVDIVERFGDGGIDRGTSDVAAYRAFMDELRKRNLLRAPSDDRTTETY